ncbi:MULTISPECIES: DnaD domain-containing protein [Listeria]|uniref:DnaD domain-containing protein n=1 Tax=Listeria TaxID=1637 RepID=UPI000B587ABD|nr:MULTISPECIES: DnaD domain-containing protein [Listeria]
MEKNELSAWMTEGFVTLPQILIKHYTKLNIDETEFMLVLQIEAFRVSGNSFPSISELTERMGTSFERVTRLLESLVRKGNLAILAQENKLAHEVYSLEPLYQKLAAFLANEELTNQKEAVNEAETHIYRTFESEFGRPLSPLEAEMLSGWLDQDHFAPELIREALKEAVISQKLNFRYIDRILLNWKKEQVKTVEDARRIAENFHQNGRTGITTNRSDIQKSKDSIPLYDWLENRKG